MVGLHSLTHTSIGVFSGVTLSNNLWTLHLPCTYDFRRLGTHFKVIHSASLLFVTGNAKKSIQLTKSVRNKPDILLLIQNFYVT